MWPRDGRLEVCTAPWYQISCEIVERHQSVRFLKDLAQSMSNDKFPHAANREKAQQMLDRIRYRYARGHKANKAEKDDPAMNTGRIAEEQGIPAQHIRRDKQLASRFSKAELERACKLRQPNGMPLQLGHLQKVVSIADPDIRHDWLEKAAANGWPADELSRQIAGESENPRAHGRAIKQPTSVKEGLNQLVRDGNLWLGRLEKLVEFIDGQSEAKSSSKNLAVALEGNIGATSTKKELGPAVEALGEVMTKMRKSCTPSIERKLKDVVAKR